MTPGSRLLYQGLAHAFYLASAPYFALRMVGSERYRAGLAERLSRLPSGLRRVGARRPIWIHAVSVGETRSIEPLVEELHRARPDVPIVISTVTRTGQGLARRIPHVAATFYLPLELAWIVRRVFRIVRPRLLVLVDTELWPAVLDRAYREAVPVALLNARVSDRSWPRYRRLRGFFAPLIAGLTRILAQSQEDAARLLALGADAARLEVLGSTKYDAVPARDPRLRARWREQLGLSAEQFLIVAGSTFPGEESLILSAARNLPGHVRLVLAPRHPERAGEVAGEIERAGARPCRLSRRQGEAWPAGEVVVVDTLGQLRELYAAADLAIVGKSLLEHGGQNPIEPAGQGVAIVTGPFMENFRETMELLRDAGGVVQLDGEAELAATLARLCASREECLRLGENALAAIETRRGVSRRAARQLLECAGLAACEAESPSAEVRHP